MRGRFISVGNLDDLSTSSYSTDASPLFLRHQIKIPDPDRQCQNIRGVSKVASLSKIVSAIEKNHGQVTYCSIPDEGQRFSPPRTSWI